MGKWIDVLVFGSANINYITYVTALPKAGERVEGVYMETCFGGKGANQSVAAVKLGATVALVAKMGRDQSGDDYISYLIQQGINVDYIEQVEDYSTGMSEIAISDNGENHIIAVSGANALLNAKDVGRCKKVFGEAKVLLCQLEIDLKGTLSALRRFKGISILNAAPFKIDLPEELITIPTILCVSKVDAGLLASMGQIKSLEEAKLAAKELLKRGVKSVIITMGEQGAIYLSKDNSEMCKHVPAADVKIIADTSGAGDAFVGSLAYYIARFPNLPRENHISAANACAAFSVQHRGIHSSFPGREEAQDNLCMVTPLVNVISDTNHDENSSEVVINAIFDQKNPILGEETNVNEIVKSSE